MKIITENESKTLEGVRKLFTDLYFYAHSDSWEDGETALDTKVHYFKSREEIIEYIKSNNGQFGRVYTEELDPLNYEDEDEDEDDEYDEEQDISDEVLEWLGEGYYVSWDWGLDHIQRIDEAYSWLMEYYKTQVWRELEEDDFEQIESWIRISVKNDIHLR